MISIIVPVYNAEKYLSRAIGSVRRQTFSDWELILIDDESPDRCGAICDEYARADKRIRVIHQKNGGVCAARNAGLDAAFGEYIYFLDADDYLPEKALETLYRYMTEKNADLVFAGHNRVEADGNIHCDSEDWPELKTTGEIQQAVLQNRLPNFVWGKLYRKGLWEGIHMPEGQVMEDLYVCPSVFMRANHIVLDKQPLYFYSHENIQSITSVGGKAYARLRYGKFLAWREHEKIARQYFPAEAEKCVKEALYAAVRVRSLDAGAGFLTQQEKAEIDLYIKKYFSTSKDRTIRILSRMILGNQETILHVLGKIQRMLINYQQRRRQKRMQKKFAKRNPS